LTREFGIERSKLMALTPPPVREVLAAKRARHAADTANAPVPPIGEYLKAREELRTEREATK